MIDWNKYYQMAGNTATNDINPDSGAPYMTNSAGFGADDYLLSNNMIRFQDPSAPIGADVSNILRQMGYPTTAAGEDTYQFGPGQAIQGPNGDWFWQTNGTPQAPKDWGIADQQNGSDWIGKGIVAATLAGFGSGLPGLFGAGAGAAGDAGGMMSNLPSRAGGAPEGLGGGAAGTGLGGASAAAQGLTTGAGVGSGFAAGGGAFGGAGLAGTMDPSFYSDLAQWAGGQGGTSLSGQQNLLQQLQQMGATPQQAAQVLQQLGGQGQQGGGAQGGQPGGGFNLSSLLPLLGVGSGLNTMLNRSNAVDPNMIAALWQAGQNTYNTSLDPQRALYNQTAQQVQDQSRAADSVRGIGMGGVSAGNENDAMRKFNIDWQNQQLGRQAQGVQSFAQAGNVGANAGLANNAQAFFQNQTGLNNLTTGLGQIFGGGGTQGNAGGNAIGSWLNGLFSGGGGAQGGQSMMSQGGGSYNPFPTMDQSSLNTGGQPLGGGVGGLGLGGAPFQNSNPMDNPYLNYGTGQYSPGNSWMAMA